MFLNLFVLAATAEPASTVSEIDFTALFIKMIALLAVIIVLGFVLMRYFGSARRIGGKAAENHFHMLSWYRLDPKKMLYLVQIGKRKFVLGGTDSSVNLITEMSSDDLEE